MQPFREKSAPKTVSNIPNTLINDPQIWLALATLPCLGVLIAGRTITYGLQSAHPDKVGWLGQARSV
ncbi:MAG: hypothetical protein AAFY17_16850, partial [Cyanobacteria bacterium J06642_11]